LQRPAKTTGIERLSVYADAEKGIIGNGYIQVKPSESKPGILDLYFDSAANEWRLYNNLVVCAKRRGQWNNAEMQKLRPTLAEVQLSPSTRLVRGTYRFPPFTNKAGDRDPPNGAHMSLAVEARIGPEIRTRLYSHTDVEAAFVGNYYGLERVVRWLDDGVRPIDVLDEQWKLSKACADWKTGDFHFWEYAGGKIMFWDESGFVQWQSAPRERATVAIEVRDKPWLKEQKEPGRRWIEMVHITREPFAQGDETCFGYILP